MGRRQRMPKRARYPLFLCGLGVLVLGGLAANAEKVPTGEFAGIALMGFALLVLSVIFK